MCHEPHVATVNHMARLKVHILSVVRWSHRPSQCHLLCINSLVFIPSQLLAQGKCLFALWPQGVLALLDREGRVASMCWSPTICQARQMSRCLWSHHLGSNPAGGLAPGKVLRLPRAPFLLRQMLGPAGKLW